MKKKTGKAKVMAPDVITSLDIKLSKNDVVDMVMEEEEMRIESELELLEDDIDRNKEACTTAAKKLDDVTLYFGDKIKLKQINALMKCLPDAKQDCSTYDTERINIGTYEVRNGGPRSRLYTQSVDVGVPETTDVRITFNHQTDHYIYDTIKLCVNVDKQAIQKSKEFLALKKCKEEYIDLHVRYHALKEEKASLDKRSRRAKAKLVRDMLSSTESGKAIMDSMKQFQKSLPAPKKKK